MSFPIKKDTKVSLSADFQDPLSNIFGTSHTKPIKFQKPKMILLSEQKKLNPVDFTAKTQLRSPHKFLLNDQEQTPVRFDQSQRILRPISLEPKTLKNINFHKKPSPLAKNKEGDFLKIADLLHVNSALYPNSTNLSYQSPSPISFLENRFTPDLHLEKNPEEKLQYHRISFPSKFGSLRIPPSSLLNNSKLLLKELTRDDFSSSKNAPHTSISTKKSLEKLGLITNLARQNKRKDQFELMSSTKESDHDQHLAINLTKSHTHTRKRKLLNRPRLKVQGLKNFESFSKEVVVTSPY